MRSLIIEDKLTPSEIRTIREKLGLSQTEAGKLLGGGARAFTKYEAGTNKPTAAVINLLRLLNDNPQLLETFIKKPTPTYSVDARSPFETLGKHIEMLDATSLIEVTKRLIFAEAHAYSIPFSDIHIAEVLTATDAGEDARIEWAAGPERTRYFRTRLNQFQLKAGKIDTKRAGREVLRKDGTPKKLVASVLSQQHGNYTMLCAQNYTHKEIENRRKAIFDTLTTAGLAINSTQIAFFDASMIAGWVNTLPAVAVWVLEKTEHSLLSGFRTWDYWASSTEHQVPLIQDDRLNPLKTSLLDCAINPKAVRRVVGASAIGKSRLVLEAFRPEKNSSNNYQGAVKNSLLYVNEETAGTNAIKLAIQNIADSGMRCIMIVDRCNIQTHRELATLVKRSESQISLISIDDEIPGIPDAETIVIQKSHRKITDGILRTIGKHIPEGDFNRISKFAEGFPKIAKLIADGMEFPHDLAHAIVLGRDTRDPDLTLRGAQVLALFGMIYDGEIDIVAKFGRNLDAASLRAAIQRLQERGIVQRKGDAIVLQIKPLSLLLAEAAWHELGKNRWDEVVEGGLSDGLKIRAIDQLAMLNTSKLGNEVGSYLLRFAGPFGDIEKISTGVKHRLFEKLAEIDLEAALYILQSGLGTLTNNEIKNIIGPLRRSFVHALEIICFKAETFERGATLMLKLAVNENENWANNATGQFISLFPIQLSDTQAGSEARISVIEESLKCSDTAQKIIIAKSLLEAQRLHSFSRSLGSETHGMRPALEPWIPKTETELWNYIEWATLSLLELACGIDEVAEMARRGLGYYLRSLAQYNRSGLIDHVILKIISNVGAGWPEAIEGLGHFLEYDSADADQHFLMQVRSWILQLSPKSLGDRVELLILNMPWDYPCGEPLDFEEQNRRQAEDIDILISELIKSPEELQEALLKVSRFPAKKLDGRQNQRRTFSFGEGLAKLSQNYKSEVDEIVNALEKTEAELRDFSPLCGFLAEAKKSDPQFVETFKLEMSKNLLLVSAVPQLCAALSVQDEDIPLCLKLLDNQKIEAWQLGVWGYGGALKSVTISAASTLFNSLFSRDHHSYVTGVNLLGMYVHSRINLLDQLFPELQLMAQNISSEEDRNAGYNMNEHHFKKMMEWALSKGKSHTIARGIASTLAKQLVENNGTFAREMIKPLTPILLSGFSEITWAILGQAIISDRKKTWRLESLLSDKYSFEGNPRPAILSFPEELLFAWCHAHPEIGPKFLAAILPVLTSRRPDDAIRGIHPIMKRLLDEFGDSVGVLDALSRNIGTYGWSGSRTKYYELYETPLKILETHKIRKVRFWAMDMIKNLGLQKAQAQKEHDHFEAENDITDSP